MKKIIFFISLFSANIIFSSQPPPSLQPLVSAGHQRNVNATADALHNSITSGIYGSYWSQCSQEIIVGVSVAVVAFILEDIYKGSKGGIYRLLCGLTPAEEKDIETVKNLKLENESLEVKNVEGHTKLFAQYEISKNRLINQEKDERKKQRLLDEYNFSTQALVRRQELSLHKYHPSRNR